MTILEAIKSFPGLSDVSDNLINKMLIDRSLSGAVDYSRSDSGNIELCVADIYSEAVNAPDFAEGRLTVSMQRSWLINTAIRYYTDNGEIDNANKLKSGKVSDKSNRW